MKSYLARIMGIATVLGTAAVFGCSPESKSETDKTIGEKTGAAVTKAVDATKEAADTAVEKTGEALKTAGAAVTNAVRATKEAADKAVDKTGETLEKAGEDMQK